MIYTATINWGDQTPSTAGTVTQPGGPGTTYIVSGTHTYNGLGPISGTSRSKAPTEQWHRDTHRRCDRQVTTYQVIAVPVAATEGQSFTGEVAIFLPQQSSGSFASSSVTYTATINWGDQTPSTAGTVTQPGGPGTTYASAGRTPTMRLGPISAASRSTAPTEQWHRRLNATVEPDLTVYNTNDDTNPGSLRHAIIEVDEGLGNYVPFRIPGNGPFTIAPHVPLPLVTRTATFDATTEPGIPQPAARRPQRCQSPGR